MRKQKKPKIKYLSNKELLKRFLDYVELKKIPENVDLSSRSWLEWGVMGESREYLMTRVCIMQKRKGGVLFPFIIFADNKLYYGALYNSEYFIRVFKNECKKRGIKCWDFLTTEDIPGWLSIQGELNTA